MSTPPPPSPERRVLHERTPSERNRLQIRLVPYSPPRLSSDADGAPVSPSSRAASHAACSPSSPSSPSAWPAHGRARGGHDDESQDQENNQSLHDQGSNQNRGFRSQRCSSPSITRTCVVPSPSSSARVDGSVYATSDSSLNAHQSAAAVFARLSSCTQPSASPSPSPSPSRRRPKKVIVNVHSDKTFSLLHQADSNTDAPRSPRLSSTVPSSSYDLSFSDVLGDDRCSTPLTPLHEQTPRPASPRSGDFDPSSSSPWNYRFVGGLRKVHRSASDSCQILPVEASCSGESDRAPARLPEARPANLSSVSHLHAKQPSRSSQSGSTSSERSNYKTYPHSSPALPAADANLGSAEVEFESLPPTSSHSNIDILGESSSDQSVDDQQRPGTGESEANYLVHGDQSPSSSFVGPRAGLRSEYSRESLLVPPLRTAKRNVEQHRQPALSKSHSRESIRSRSLSSISSIIIEEATRSLFGVAATVHMPGGVLRQKSSPRPFNTGPTFQQHPWSSTLSTVISESEGGNDCASRSLSPLSGHGHRSSQTGGVSPSLNEVEETQTRPCLTTDRSPVLPPAAYCRLPNRDQNYSTVRLVRDHDEHGDGLADLEALHHRPSHTRLYSFLSNYSSDRNLRSSSSSRSNSFSHSAIPAWARLYYGSGERRFLAAQPSSDSLFSEFNAGPPGSVSHSRSPSADRPTAALHNPRRHPRDATVSKGRAGPGVDEIRPFPDVAQPREVKKQTSSIWSPHLGWDKRIRRYSIWQPPSAVWSTQNRSYYRRNPQPILFVIGFIFPFAWMLASFLPLPPKPQLEMEESHLHSDHLDLRNRTNHHMQWTIEAHHYSRAQWWRALNRAMAIVGIFIVGAIVALIVTGVKQKWGS